jgi:hydroxypyruvate reductase
VILPYNSKRQLYINLFNPRKKQEIIVSHFGKEILAQRISNVIFERNGKLGSDACEILASAVDAVDPYQCVLNTVKIFDDRMDIDDQSCSLDQIGRIFVIGFGKSAVPMAKAMIDLLGENITKAAVITKDKKFLEADGYKGLLVVHLGGHPVPSSASIQATTALLDGLPPLAGNDLVLVLISGGGSALFTKPMKGVPLDDMQRLTEVLLKCGADINEINTLRKHLDQVKGGRLAERLAPALVKTLILSDVIGDPLDMIASGPTVPDPTTYADTLSIIEKYNVKTQIPKSVLNYLQSGLQNQEPETPKKGQISEERVQNFLIGTNIKALEAGRKCAEEFGYNSLILSSHLTGHTGDVAEFLSGIIRSEFAYNRPVKRPVCLLFGGETTVSVTGKGLGGRNQDLVLKMVRRIRGQMGVLFVSFATDGDDGPTDAAGAVCDGQLYDEAVKEHHIDIGQYIADCDSYHFHQKLGSLIKTGSTGTNVNDIILIMVGHLNTN